MPLSCCGTGIVIRKMEQATPRAGNLCHGMRIWHGAVTWARLISESDAPGAAARCRGRDQGVLAIFAPVPKASPRTCRAEAGTPRLSSTWARRVARSRPSRTASA